MMKRRLACCTRDREISLDFDEQEGKALSFYSTIIIFSHNPKIIEKNNLVLIFFL